MTAIARHRTVGLLCVMLVALFPGVVRPRRAEACEGSCGDTRISAFGSTNYGYGEPVVLSGDIFDDSGSCNDLGLCDDPTGHMKLSFDGEEVATVGLLGDQSDKHWFSFFGSPSVYPTAGTHTAQYDYQPGNFDPDSSSRTITVDKEDTRVFIASQSPSSGVGEPVHLTATVHPVDSDRQFPFPATGLVAFYDGFTLVGVTNAANYVATMDVTPTTITTHEFTAQYDGDDNFKAQIDLSDTIPHEVTKATSQVSIGALPGTRCPGDPVTVTATVKGINNNTLTPTGNVTFQNAVTHAFLGEVAVDGAGVATMTSSSLPLGQDTIEAIYAGDTNFTTNSGGVLVTVAKGDVTLAITQSKETTVFGEHFSTNGTIAPVAPTTTTIVGTIDQLDPGNPTVSFGFSGTLGSFDDFPSVGTHQFTWKFTSSDGKYNDATSNTLTHTVDKASTQTSISANHSDPLTFGQPVTFSADVSVVAPGAGTPTGSVQFTDNGSPLGSPVALSGTHAAFTTSTLGGGAHHIQATYSGDGNFYGGSSAVIDRTVPCSATVIGTVPTYTASSGVTCFANATVNGTLTVNHGASVSMVNTTVTSVMNADGSEHVGRVRRSLLRRPHREELDRSRDLRRLRDVRSVDGLRSVDVHGQSRPSGDRSRVVRRAVRDQQPDINGVEWHAQQWRVGLQRQQPGAGQRGPSEHRRWSLRSVRSRDVLGSAG